MPGKENAKKGAKSSSSEGAAIDETSFSEQSRRDLRELFTMIARLQAENNALRATAHLESITERLKEQVEKLESPQPAKEQGNPLSRRLQRLAEIAIDLPLDIKDDDLSVSDLALLCTVLEDDMRRGALISFAGDSVTFPMLSFCAEESHQDSHHGNRGGRAGRGGRGGRYNGRGSHHGGGHWQGGPFPGQAPVHTATHSTTIHDGSPAPPRYAAEFQHGQFHSHQPVSIGPALLPYQFAPQVPWQPVNQPPNPFSQHQQVSQTQDASPNNVQSNDHRKKRRRRKQERSDHTDAQVVTQVEADQVPSSGPQDTSPSQQELVQGRELRTPHLNYRGSTLSADENPGSSMRRSFIDNNELVNDITWLARPGTRERRCRGTPLDFLEPVILSYKRRVVIPIDEDMPYVDRSQQPSAPRVPAICGGCKQPGHNIIQCCVKDENGFTTGCGVCNSGEHETDMYQSFSKDTLFKKRACFPPLKTKYSFWYPLMWKWVKANPSADTSHLFP
ncbi:hypothetical protein HZS61_011910 [Fusarium oxysporum f. sp. conglutinans]|uniref:Uncharacterized protein n=1 Tax=Fusarium oxysporum f. sp. conglutinans TaxID=100902 RepID=A0A8H6LLQ6_FUSOX|nr:hypothetical protein HZS61_011910 [Fusarium oxysporum f. sp. conglutinans]